MTDNGRPDAVDSLLCLLGLLYKLEVISWEQYGGQISGTKWADVLAYVSRHAPLHPDYDPNGVI